MDYPCYKSVDGNDIEQGDLILNCPIAIPPKEYKTSPEDNEFGIVEMDAVILSQSCDLAQRKIEIVLVCPFFSLKDYLQNIKLQDRKSRAEDLRKGRMPAYHLLNKQEGLIDDFLVVDFRYVYGIHLDALSNIVEKTTQRTRMLSPYKEHLSQAFARYFMRVGLPQDISIPDSYYK